MLEVNWFGNSEDDDELGFRQIIMEVRKGEKDFFKNSDVREVFENKIKGRNKYSILEI